MKRKSVAQVIREEQERLTLLCFPTPAMKRLESIVDVHVADANLRPEAAQFCKAGLLQLLALAPTGAYHWDEGGPQEKRVTRQEVRVLADSVLADFATKIAREVAQTSPDPIDSLASALTQWANLGEKDGKGVVDPLRGDDSNPGTREKPIKTFAELKRRVARSSPRARKLAKKKGAPRKRRGKGVT